MLATPRCAGLEVRGYGGLHGCASHIIYLCSKLISFHLGLLLRRLADQDGVVILHKGGGGRDHAHSALCQLARLLVDREG